MMVIKILSFLLLNFLTGYIFLCFFIKEKKPLLFISALSYGAGASVLAIQLFGAIFIGRVSFSTPVFFTVIFLELLLTATFLFIKKRLMIIERPRFNCRDIKAVTVILLTLIALQLFGSLVNCLSLPAAAYDSITMWSFKAEALYYDNKINFDPSSFAYLGGGGHRNYPWQIPLSQFLFHKWNGVFNDLNVSIIFWLYFASSLILLYYFLRKRLSIDFSLFFTFLLATIPLYFYHSYNAYADLTLGYYLLASFVFWLRWLSEKRNEEIILSVLFASFSFFIKDTAVIFLLPYSSLLIFSFFHSKVPARFYIYCGSAFILPLLPWLFFKAANHLGVSNVDSGLGLHLQVLPSFFNGLVISNSWNIWWIFAAITFMLFWNNINKNKEGLYGWILLFLSFAAVFVLYLFTERYKYALDYTAFLRNIMVILPFSVYLVGITYGLINNKQ